SARSHTTLSFFHSPLPLRDLHSFPTRRSSDLPELEAHEPAELRGSGRDDVRMIVSYRPSARGEEGRTPSSAQARRRAAPFPGAAGGRGRPLLLEAHFRDLPDFLRAGDLLVLNTSATLPAALTAVRANGDEIALHWSASLPGGLDLVEPRKIEARAGERFTLPGGATATLLTPYRDSHRLWIA